VKSSRLPDLFSLFRTSTRERWDGATPLAMAALSTIGLFFIYSAQFSSSADSAAHETVLGWINRSYWMKQALFLGFGAVCYVAVSLVDYRQWLSVAHWIYVICMIPLVLVLFIGTRAYGSQRWIDLGFFHFQPSETVNIAILLITASILIRSKIGTVSQSLGVLGKLTLAVGSPILLILLQPDLKSAIVLPPMVFSMLYVSKLSSRFFAGALGAFLLIVGIVAFDTWRYAQFMDRLEAQRDSSAATSHESVYLRDRGAYESHSWVPLRDYQRNRILSFVDPDRIDPMGIGWNQRQSLISVGSGGLTGKGWTEGTQARLGYLPRSVAHNDFIFSVLAEEKGFLGSITVLSLFGVVLFNGIRIAGLARDRLGTLLAIGVTVLFTVHVFVNIAMTIGLVPITGIPLPFISYGGSFVLSCCLLQGLVQSVYRFRKDFP
jgi:rod shape determining protein RodA